MRRRAEAAVGLFLDAISDASAQQIGAGIELADSLGCHTLDLGPSDDDQPGLIRFKRQSGAEEHELEVLRFTPPGWSERPGVAERCTTRPQCSLVSVGEPPQGLLPGSRPRRAQRADREVLAYPPGDSCHGPLAQ